MRDKKRPNRVLTDLSDATQKIQCHVMAAYQTFGGPQFQWGGIAPLMEVKKSQFLAHVFSRPWRAPMSLHFKGL